MYETVLCDAQDEWIFFTYPLDYLGVRTDIDLDCGPSFRSSHHELSPTGSLEIIPEVRRLRMRGVQRP